MSDFDKEMNDALQGPSGFDPSRAHSAQTQLYQTFNNKQKRNERAMALLHCLFIAAGLYALWGFILFADTPKAAIGYGMVVMWAVLFLIQINILGAISNARLLTMKEVKQLHLALASGTASPGAPYARPLRGLSTPERIVWVCAIMAFALAAALLGMRTDRQDNLWSLQAQNRVEARSVLTLRRFPHQIRQIMAEAPVEGAILESATLNGQPVAFESNDSRNLQYHVRLPYRMSWRTSKIELVWSFALPEMENYSLFRARLKSLMPVHGYSLIVRLEEGSGFEPTENAWKFNKSPEELANESEARRTVKAFTTESRGQTPSSDFGTCGLGIRRAP